VIYLKTMYKYL